MSAKTTYHKKADGSVAIQHGDGKMGGGIGRGVTGPARPPLAPVPIDPQTATVEEILSLYTPVLATDLPDPYIPKQEYGDGFFAHQHERECPRCRKAGRESGTRFRKGDRAQCFDCENFDQVWNRCKRGGRPIGDPDFIPPASKKGPDAAALAAREEELRNRWVEWRRSQPAVCHYCGTHEKDVWRLDYRPSRLDKDRKVRVDLLGVDRVDSGEGYILPTKDPQTGAWVGGNMVLCCAMCNGMKSNTISQAEFDLLRPQLKEIARLRLAAHDPELPTLL